MSVKINVKLDTGGTSPNVPMLEQSDDIHRVTTVREFQRGGFLLYKLDFRNLAYLDCYEVVSRLGRNTKQKDRNKICKSCESS